MLWLPKEFDRLLWILHKGSPQLTLPERFGKHSHLTVWGEVQVLGVTAPRRSDVWACGLVGVPRAACALFRLLEVAPSEQLQLSKREGPCNLVWLSWWVFSQ